MGAQMSVVYERTGRGVGWWLLLTVLALGVSAAQTTLYIDYPGTASVRHSNIRVDNEGRRIGEASDRTHSDAEERRTAEASERRTGRAEERHSVRDAEERRSVWDAEERHGSIRHDGRR